MSQQDAFDWYHGKLSRADAENILLEGSSHSLSSSYDVCQLMIAPHITEFSHIKLLFTSSVYTESHISNSDGIFLVRESAGNDNSSSTHSLYVLSVFFESEFFHYQIHQHGEDAFFSIAIDSNQQQQPIHGMEHLIDFYRKNKSNFLHTQLKTFVKKSSPPLSTRRDGISNLLHRATKKNQMTVVKEMLKTSYRNLDAKGEHGMTAVHLACKHRVDPEILRLLIDRGAAVSTRDSSGNTPLHVS